ncbi:hypothetical protein CKO41_00165 [Thiococcus pfennigii]|nr:hypothetical protein [Thiococcus pfennigii]MBK1730236.1 hypothetical protein [Thiococcus pfennigii]
MPRPPSGLFDGLRESFGRQNGSKAPRVDGVRQEDYAKGAEPRQVPQRYGVRTIMQCITANRGSATWG